MHKKLRRFGVSFMIAAQVVLLIPVQSFAQNPESQSMKPQSVEVEYDKPNSGTQTTYMGKKLYTGQVHSHTSLSDGKGLPEDAWQHVRENTTLDFYGVTEHDVCLDYRNGDDYLTDVNHALSDDWRFIHETADLYNEDGKFVTVAGEEITWYDHTGHMNLFNTDWKITAYAKERRASVGSGDVKYDLPTFYARVAQDPNAIAQFNHPTDSGWGEFWSFTHYTKEADAQVDLFEYKATSYLETFQTCLDAGWHVSPTYNGDEHNTAWGEREQRTGIWTDSKTRESLYKAFREHNTYCTFDSNFELIYSANDSFMGSILSGDTTKFQMYAKLYDPDKTDLLKDVTIYTNKKQVVKKYENIDSNELVIEETFSCSDGDYFFIVANQKDGQQIVSAPIWVGEITQGTNFAPEITVNGEIPETVSLNQTVTIPSAAAVDDTDGACEVTVDVTNSEGEVVISDNTFTPDAYDDYYIRYRAKDRTGSTRVELFRITVDKSNMNADVVFGQFAPVASIGKTSDEVGINVVTDAALTTAYLQYAPADARGWDHAVTVMSEEGTMQLEVVSKRNAPDFENPVTDKPLRSHEFDLTGLAAGTQYKYRLGVAENGGWTSEEYTFATVLPEGKASLYLMGDLQVPGTDQSKYQLFNDMLAVLKEKEPEGSVMVQLGDFVDNAAKYEYWKCLSDYVISDLNMLTSTMTGNHETNNDLNKAHSHSDSIYTNSSTFTKMYNLPENGSALGESNYSYDMGEMHIAVLNSTTALDEQLAWLKGDMRDTEKPWRIVMGHFPYYGSRHSTDAGMAEEREKVSEVFQQLGVSLYIGGHDHVYKRTTIRDGVATNDAEDINQGTTFVTAGSAGPKFYDNEEFWWDNVVYDEDVQTGMVLTADTDHLTLTTYTMGGEVVDTFTLGHAEGLFELSSTDIEDKEWKGVGFLSTADSRENITILAAKYSEDESQLLEVRTEDVTLERKGKEQYIAFDTPITFDSSNVLKVMVWEGLDTSQPLLNCQTLRKGMKGFGTKEQPYEIYTWEDLNALVFEPNAHFKLMNDLNLDGEIHEQLGSKGVNFTGVFDGDGHRITGFCADANKGAGLFATNDGVIRNLSVTDAQAESAVGPAGILCDVNRGTIENCYTSGSITANTKVGGVTGSSYGTVRNCYSTADVRSLTTEAGGVVGLGQSGSVTDSCYATGNILSDTRNAGGVVGYGYNETVVQNCMALNGTVNGTIYSNRVLGRILSGNNATLINNYGSPKVIVEAEKQGLAQTTTEKGATATLSEARSQQFFEETLGWDFETVWQWNENGNRPVLQVGTEQIEPSADVKRPDLQKDANGNYIISTADELAVISEFPEENYVLANDISITESMSPLCKDAQFLGIFDGAGHKIMSYTSAEGGLFHMNAGVIKNLGMENAVVQALEASNIGILCNTNNGIIENCYTTGSISGKSTAGGVVGYLYGTIRNCYSTASAQTSGRQAGGVVGISGRGSITMCCYATGEISASANAGGITGYTYATTVVNNNIARNASVTATAYGHRVAARTLSDEIAEIGTNFAWSGMLVSKTADEDFRLASLMGEDKTLDQIRSVDTYINGLGWDFESVWQWDDAAKRPVLKNCVEKIVVQPDTENPDVENPDVENPDVENPEVQEPDAQKPNLAQDSNGFYQISSVEDLSQISKFPEENYILTTDLDFVGQTIEKLCTDIPFSGIFDGAGYKLINFISNFGGLFKESTGTIRCLGMENAHVTADFKTTGILCDVAGGVIEQCYTTGSITGMYSQGGIVGNLKGRMSNCYCAADVTVSGGRYAGGLVGISAKGSGSVIENCYSTGAITVVDDESAGGITGYTYSDSTVKNCFALNASVTASNFAHRIAARTLSKQVAILENNFALTDMPVENAAAAESRTEGWMGVDKTLEESQQQSTFESDLGWDFNSVWKWDENTNRPILKCQES